MREDAVGDYLVILGTDTNAGKTTFALLWLTAFGDRYAYWKPVETGESDTATIRRLVPQATIHDSAQRFREPVAPPLAARQEGAAVWPAARIAAARPLHPRMLIESFGSPFSPLNETELQVELIRRLAGRAVLVSSTALGAIGRTLQTLEALHAHGLTPAALVLIGQRDSFAEQSLCRHGRGLPVFTLTPPTPWSNEGLTQAVANQREALERLQATFEIAAKSVNMPSTTQDLVARDRQVVWHPYTSLRDPAEPLAIVGAEREFLHLADGRRLIDGISSWWTILHGHRPPFLMEALAEASRQIDHVLFAGATHPWGVELAELLLQSMPWTGGRVFYSDNGSTAVEVALKMAYECWRHRGEQQRTRFIGFEHGYHGDTFGAMAVSRDPVFFSRFGPLLFKADIRPLDPDRLDQHLQVHAHETAAVIIEPLVQGAGGMQMHSPATLRQLFEVTHRHNVLFIADEVMTGGGRTGTLWASQSAGIAPDFVCAAKTLAGGILPLAATLVAPEIVKAFDTDDRSHTFFHGHSFTAHPLACAVGVANWKRLTAHPPRQPSEIQAFWQQAVTDVRGRPGVAEVRIRGIIAAIELDGGGGYLAEIGPRMREICLAHGVLLRPLGNVLYALPPLETSQDSLERTAAAMKAAVEAVT